MSTYRERTLSRRSLPTVTLRERTSAALVLVGAVAVVVAAFGFGGWVLACATAGGLMFGVGVLLGVDGGEVPLPAPADLGDTTERLQ